MQDGAVRIFLNTRGKNDNEVSQELVSFLHYLENTTDEMAEKMDSVRIQRIHDRVCKVKNSEEVGVRYMQAWEEKFYEREEGKIDKLKELIEKKLKKEKSIEQIADELEEDVSTISELICEMKAKNKSEEHRDSR